MTETSSWVAQFTDEQLLDLLGLSPERMADPARWCRDLRNSCAVHERGFATSAEVDCWRETAERLCREAT